MRSKPTTSFTPPPSKQTTSQPTSNNGSERRNLHFGLPSPPPPQFNIIYRNSLRLYNTERNADVLFDFHSLSLSLSPTTTTTRYRRVTKTVAVPCDTNYCQLVLPHCRLPLLHLLPRYSHCSPPPDSACAASTGTTRVRHACSGGNCWPSLLHADCDGAAKRFNPIIIH